MLPCMRTYMQNWVIQLLMVLEWYYNYSHYCFRCLLYS